MAVAVVLTADVIFAPSRRARIRRVIYSTDEPDRVDERLGEEGDPEPGQFPSEQAALQVLYLAVRNLEEFCSPYAGIRSSGWKRALQAFTIFFD